MANIVDYISWRGDLSFEASPFCEVDNYILAKIGCPDFTGIVPSDKAQIGIREAINSLFSEGNEDRTALSPLSSPNILPMLRLLPATERFGTLRLSGFTSRLDFENTEQFSALTIILPDGTSYVSFRGTDDTIIAWKENFYMASMEAVPAQLDAAKYLEWAADVYDGPIIVGGHSKGGNLAVYAAASVPQSVQERIVAVYNNDGPGFKESFLTSPGYLRIKHLIHNILPRNSIVGTLLTQTVEPELVECSSAGIAAHDGFTWEVMGPGFVRCDSLSRGSAALDAAIDDTLAGMDTEQRRELVEALFDALTSTGAVYLGDFSEHRLRQALEIAMHMRGEKEIYRFVSGVLSEMLKEYLPARKNKTETV